MRIQGFASASLRTIDTKRGKEEMQGDNGSLGKLGGKTARLGGVSPPSRIGYPKGPLLIHQISIRFVS